MNKALATAIWILTVISAYWMGLEHDSVQSNNSFVASLDGNLEKSALPQKNNFVLPDKGRHCSANGNRRCGCSI